MMGLTQNMTAKPWLRGSTHLVVGHNKDARELDEMLVESSNIFFLNFYIFPFYEFFNIFESKIAKTRAKRIPRGQVQNRDRNLEPWIEPV